MSIVAPAGFGKTTLVAQWAARDDRLFATVLLEPGLDAAALAARVDQALSSQLGSAAEPCVVVFDDSQLIQPDAAGVVEELAHRLPDGSTVALAGRRQAVNGVARLRAGGALLELGPEDLALSRREAREMLYAGGVALSEPELHELLLETEGWPAGVRLATLGRHDRNGRTAPGDSLEERELAGLLRPENLADLTRDEREFLRRTAILERMSGPLCDAVLERRGSARLLESFEASGLFVLPLDRDREWFRYHRAFGRELRRDLAEREPALVSVLERRASDWLEANGDPEGALRHATETGDTDHVARILDRAASPLHNDGREVALAGWITHFEEIAALDDYPRIATIAARLNAQRGKAVDAERCLTAATRGAARRRGDASLESRIALVRAGMCAGGLESMLDEVESVLDTLPADDRWRPYALLLQGTANALLGNPDRGDAILSRAVHASERLDACDTRVLALAERSVLAAARGDRPEADALLARGRATIERRHLQGYTTSALTLALSARSSLLHGRLGEATTLLASARCLLPGLTGGLPWLAVQARLELAGAYVTLRDRAPAGGLLEEVDELLAACPKLGDLCRRRDELTAETAAIRANGGGRGVGLTSAELRLLPMLATHLSFREIGLRFFLSRNTVKTQAISVYRKLGASSRSEAVVQAERLGLIDSEADPAGLILTG